MITVAISMTLNFYMYMYYADIAAQLAITITNLYCVSNGVIDYI